MDDITKGLRELIRSIMREKGIKHYTYKKEITSICYAQRPTTSIEFEGPVRITHCLDKAIVKLTAYGYTEKQNHNYYVLSNSQTYHEEFNDTIVEIDQITVEISRPDMAEVISSFLDAHIPTSIKQPKSYKRLVCGTPGKPKYKYFVRSTDYATLSMTLSIISKLKNSFLKLLSIDLETQDFYWEQAIKRHYDASNEELREIKQTVLHMRTTDKPNICHTTNIILNQKRKRK